ncbi:class I SAM-dependent methyltransferase [Metabacillus sp. 84]|uniref:class I SAM-dependent methyltransferase n=1 Tax=Metabacillus sp. 84 TaxID=3404705 RepID=UPI003CE92823
MKNYGKDLFKGTASYYAKYRPVYPPELVRFLVNRYSLDGTGRLLDLGCGTGQLTLRFADWFERITGIDPEEEMLIEAKRRSEDARIGHCEWIGGRAEDYVRSLSHDSIRLVMIAKAFHWMDQQTVLGQLYEAIAPGGGVAIIDAYHPGQQLEPWQEETERIVKKWYGEERKAGNTVYAHPPISYEERMNQSPFQTEVIHLPVHTVKWSIESIIGNLYSTSCGRPVYVNEFKGAFEKDLHRALQKLNEKNEFQEHIGLNLILGMKEAEKRSKQ